MTNIFCAGELYPIETPPLVYYVLLGNPVPILKHPSLYPPQENPGYGPDFGNGARGPLAFLAEALGPEIILS